MTLDPFFAKHARRVNQWYARQSRGRPLDAASDLCGKTLAMLWKAADEMLGRPTADAIMDRVLANTRDRYPWLRGLKFARGRLSPLPAVNLGSHSEATCFLVTEFIATVSILTGGVANDRLYAELEQQ